MYVAKETLVYVFSRDELTETVLQQFFPPDTKLSIEGNIYTFTYISIDTEITYQLQELDRVVIYPVSEIAVMSKDIINDHFKPFTGNS